MHETNFLKWVALREQSESDPITSLPQKQGDILYFGVHDVAKKYKESGSLPSLSMTDIESKKGEITDVDPVDQIVHVAVSKAPFHYGYRKLEGEKDKMKRYMRDDGQMEVKVSVANLQDISHLVPDASNKVWLVIDGNTSYQKNLMREIRKKEVGKASKPAEHPLTRHYDDYEGTDMCLDSDDDDKEYMHVAHFDPSLTSKTYGWKRFNETRRYDYYPQ